MRWICNKKTAEVGRPLVATGVALIIGALFILLADESPIKARSSLVWGALGTPQSIANTISKNIPLAFTGLIMAMGPRCGTLSIDAEGQLHAGTMASVIAAFILNFLPAPVLLVVSILAGILAGMTVGSIPGVFRARLSTNEVIMAIMFNYICTLFTSYLVNGPHRTEGSTAQTELVAEEIWFGKLLSGTQLTVALFPLLFIATAMYIFLWKTSVGYRLWAMRVSPSAVGTADIRVNLSLIMSMTLSGDTTTLVGATEVFGKYHRFIEGFSLSFGFTGIAVTILGRNHSTGVLLTALFFGVIDVSSLRTSRETMVSTDTVTVIQSLVVPLAAAPELIKWTREGG